MAWLMRSFRSRRFGKPVRKSCWAAWVICADIARATLTSRKTTTAPAAAPFAVVDRRDASLRSGSRGRRAGSGCSSRAGCAPLSFGASPNGVGWASRLVRPRSERLRPWAGRGSARPAGHGLGDEVQVRDLPTSSVQITASAMLLSVTWARSLSTNIASSIPLRSMAYRSARTGPGSRSGP